MMGDLSMDNLKEDVQNNIQKNLKEINESRLQDLQDMVNGTYKQPEPTEEELYWSNVGRHGDGRFGAGHPY